jgi:hypothetical protein
MRVCGSGTASGASVPAQAAATSATPRALQPPKPGGSPSAPL